jgi:hypothetical protein
MLEKNIQSKKKIYMYIALMYVIIVFIANWSLLLGKNTMKWDIANGHYPYMIFMGDALKNGQLPLWNPMIQYGTPQYAIAGMPVWYPISLILAIIGYSPYMMGIEYSIHMILAGFGMFLLIKDYSKSDEKYLGAILSGIIYMFSTVFISNAEHIMIIISATWIPYIMLNIKDYIINGSIKKLFLSGGYAALIILGGYPEIFAGTFLCLIPYIFIENYKIRENEKLITIILESIKVFLKLCLSTILGGSITLIPFIHSMLYITRGINSNIPVAQVSITALITSILPGTSKALPLKGDISMIYSYAGILTVITFFVILYIKNKEFKSYLYIALFAFIMSQGTSFILYELFHKFVPLFGSFRFPSTWRCLVVAFLLIPCSIVWNDIDKDEIINKLIKIITILGCCLILVGFIVVLVSGFLKDKDIIEKTIYLGYVIGIASLLVFMYIPIMTNIKNEKKASYRIQIILICACIIEVLIFQYFEFPVTVAGFKHGKHDPQYILSMKNKYKERIKNYDFKDSKITNTVESYNNADIILNHEIDENGYMSFILNKTQIYQSSANRLIMTQNPIVYFTNNVVTNKQIDLKQWMQNADVSPAQIYASKSINIKSEEIYKNIGNIKNAKVTKLDFQKKSDTLYRINNINAKQNKYTVKKLIIYTKNNKEQFENTNTFISKDGNVILKTHGISSENVIEVYLPLGALVIAPWVDISNVDIEFNRPLDIEKVEYIEGERINKDNNINVESFKLNNIKMNVDAKTDGYVVVKQAFYPGWNAYVDGKKCNIEVINDTFMGIEVRKGHSEIEFKFLPYDFIIGAVISIIYFVVMIFYILKKNKVAKLYD